MSAAERAEARRKAILAKGANRLAKLTTSARGEDATQFMREDHPLPSVTASRNFLGEESYNMPTPNRFSPSPSPDPRPDINLSHQKSSQNIFDAAGIGSGQLPDPSVWSPEQQQQFIQALMASAPSQTQSNGPHPLPSGNTSLPTVPLDNPLAAMLFPQQNGASPFATTETVSPPEVKKPTRIQKLLPLIHMIAVWSLLSYFVFWIDPSMRQTSGTGIIDFRFWRRWADLGWRNPGVQPAQMLPQLVPFFWVFITLQIVLHSLRIFSGFDVVQPPTIIALALPHLPPPFPSIIVNSLKYMQMGSLFLDDLAGLIVGIGCIVYFAGWYTAL